jgi:hypothetical protein
VKKPERHASRRLSDYLTFEGQKQKVHSLVNQVGQPCLIDPFSPDLATEWRTEASPSTGASSDPRRGSKRSRCEPNRC